MKNFVQPGVNLTILAPANYLSGDVVIVGGILGVAAGDAPIGNNVDVVTEGVFNLPKVSALAINLGDTVYWDGTAKLVTKTASGNTKMGVAVTAAENPSASVNVKLGLPV